MKEEVNIQPILQTMVQEGWAQSEEEACSAVSAFFQWVAALPDSAKDAEYLMFHGVVDRAFHACVLNTRYHDLFCRNYVGRFVNHNPLDATNAKTLIEQGGAQHTVDLLEANYGEQLHPLLQVWRESLDAGRLTPSAVSCNGCDPDDVTFSIQGGRTLLAH